MKEERKGYYILDIRTFIPLDINLDIPNRLELSPVYDEEQGACHEDLCAGIGRQEDKERGQIWKALMVS